MLNYEHFMMYLVSAYINVSKYCAIEVQLFAMKIIEGSKIVLYRVLQKLIISTVCRVSDMLFSIS